MRKKQGTSKNSVLTELCEMVLKPVTVSVMGKDLTLHPPDPDKAFALRDTLMELSRQEGSSGSYLSVLCSEAISLCVPGCDLDLAKRLFNASDGELGELAQKSMTLCGMNHLLEPVSLDKKGENETPFTLPGKPEKA